MFILLAVTLAEGCTQRRESGELLARVGESVLTRESALRFLGNPPPESSEQLIARYTRSWVREELIFQEAKKHGIENSLEFQDRVAAVKRDLLIHEFLQRYLYSDTLRIPEPQVSDYYEAHRSEFVVEEAAVKMNVALFSSREQASSFSASLARGADWNTALTTIKQRGNKMVLAANENIILTSRGFFPEEVWKVASTLNPLEPSYPVRTAEGFYVIIVQARYKPGTPADFELVRDEAKQRLITARSRQRYVELIQILRNRSRVEILFSPADSGDTTYFDHD